MFLMNVENHQSQSPWGEAAAAPQNASLPVPQIFHLLNYKPQWTSHLAAFTQAVMRGDSPLTSGERELIAAFTSRLRNCLF
jgi:alkylhydroperoxidase family enzyme